MRGLTIILALLFFISSGFTASDSELVIVKVEYTKKKDGIHANIKLDLGNSNAHSLYHNFQNDEKGTVTYKDADGKLRVFTNEVDLMNFLISLGYKFKQEYQTTVLTDTYSNFVFTRD